MQYPGRPEVTKGKVILKQSLAQASRLDRVYVLNLESRPDRRKDIEIELKRTGFTSGDDVVRIFRAIRPENPGPFPSIGARGCFLSQLGVLREARDAGHRAILLLEDDAAFSPAFLTDGAALLAELEGTDWAMAYLGHRVDPAEMPGPAQARSDHWRALDPATGVVCAHAVLFHQRAIDPLVRYLEAMLERPAGHAEGGPMHVDGAYTWFRRAHPDMLTLLTPQQYVTQRASRSDITEQAWKEKLPFWNILRRIRNRLARRI